MLTKKKFVIMPSYIWYDVAGGKIDVMIPGGGFGLFNGLTEIF